MTDVAAPGLARAAGRLRELTEQLAEPLRTPVRALVDRPGKRLRSRLVLSCARLGKADPDRIASVCAVVELLHLASLLHDDIVDDADLRRGRPAAHTVIGAEQAMLAGLAAFALAGTAAAELGAEPAALVGRAAAALAGGEVLDVERAFDTALPIEDYLELVERKTGELFGLCCLLGALEAAAEPPVVAAVHRFGAEFGIAFQIMDDCLDFGDDTLDKSAGTDHRLGLFGAPTLYALAAPTGTGDDELAALLLDPGFAATDLPEVRRLVIDRGGLAVAWELAGRHCDRALAALEVLGDDPVRIELGMLAAPGGEP